MGEPGHYEEIREIRKMLREKMKRQHERELYGTYVGAADAEQKAEAYDRYRHSKQTVPLV